MIFLKTEEQIYDEIDEVNQNKRELILQFLHIQGDDCTLYEEKIQNTSKLFLELRKCNDKLTELECEYVSLISREL